MLEGQVLALTGNALGCPSADLSKKHMGVVLKVLVKKGPLGIHFQKARSKPNREPMLWPFWGQVFRTTTICQT